MDFQELFNNKSIKPKEKTETLAKWILDNPEEVDTLIDFAKTSKDPVKATCIESMEYATKSKPEIASSYWLDYVTASLNEKAPRIKWESAKVVGNIAHLYPGKLDEAVKNLLINSEHSGTVVRWSAAFALGQIIRLKTPLNKRLLPAVESICGREEKDSIKKIYFSAMNGLSR